jgi:predicted metal-dependent hydrolase
LDRIRNARHFAPRLQRWLSEVGELIRASTPKANVKSRPVHPNQLELFAQDFFAALQPTKAPPVAPQPLFKAPPVPPRAVTPPPVNPNSPPKRHIQLGRHSIDYELRRSSRRSIGFMIDDDGLRVTAPKRVTLAEIDSSIRAKQRWIITKLGERGERRAQREQVRTVEWVDGAELPYLGEDITLLLEEATRSHCIYDEEQRTLRIGVVPGLSEWQLKERVRLWFNEQATRIFTERLDLYAAKLGVEYSSLTLSSAGTRWGSCTVHGSIRLNWRLIHFALPLIDYVVAHELAHLIEMNHSAQFWATVETIYPDYDGAREALRVRSQQLPVLFT